MYYFGVPMKTIYTLVLNFIKWTYDIFTRPAAKIGLGVLVAGGFIAGALFWHMFNLGMDKTNEEQFCLACHTMEDNLLPELQKTVHWQNRTGVRARCPDCHVPHEFTDKIARKMQASREVLAHVMGTIGTREKFKEHRIVLAQREWARFKANNSKECRNCHDYNSMDFSKMRVTSQMIMRSAAERDASCVDCHRGIAHALPDLQGARNPAFDTLLSEAQGVSVSSGVTYYAASPMDIFADEALTQQPARIGQIFLRAAHVPMDFIAVDIPAASLVLQRVAAARHLDPAQAHGRLRLERLAHGRVRLGKALGLVEPIVQRVRHILARGVAVRGHSPICPRLGLKPADRRDGRANHILFGRRHTSGLQPLEQFGAQLVAVCIVGLLVRCRAPWWLVNALLHDLGVFQHGNRCRDKQNRAYRTQAQ